MSKITKKDLIEYLDGFNDDIEIDVHCVNLIYPVSLSLSYKPKKGDQNPKVVIRAEASGTEYLATGL